MLCSSPPPPPLLFSPASFLCLRKEKKSVSPVGSSTLKSIVDPSQELSSSELLALCSGNFEETQSTTAVESERRRHPSDSSSSQTVRELLGLPAKPPQRSSISKLLASSSVMSGNSEDTQGSCMNEVLGLCSGVFPTTQPDATVSSFIIAEQCSLGMKLHIIHVQIPFLVVSSVCVLREQICMCTCAYASLIPSNLGGEGLDMRLHDHFSVFL